MNNIQKNNASVRIGFIAFAVLILIISWATTVFATTADTVERSISYYNPAGTFNYIPDPAIQPAEREMKAGLLFDLENNKIVWQKEMNTPFPIASLTKMMVALLTVEDIHAGKINWTDQVSWTRNIVIGRGRHKKIVAENVSYSLLDIFKAAMIASNNEAAEQMARYVGGDVALFVDRMNTRARELSMNSTYYGNPTGLPAASRAYDNSSTPTDLLQLTLEMLKYDEILEVTGMGYADIHNGKNTSIIRNHNHLTIDYKGEVDGMKTGYTRRAGFCLVATSNKCDQRLISIVLGARSPGLRNEAVKNMLNDYYSSIGLDKLGPYCNMPNPNDPNQDPGFITKTVKQTYIVKRGDDLGGIAYHFNCTPSDIKTWNRLRTGKVPAGRKLVILTTVREPMENSEVAETESGEELPAVENSDAPAVQSTAPAAPVTATANPKLKSSGTALQKSKYIIHVVQPGDTLFSIARQYDVPNVARLKAVNKISKTHMLRVGSRIRVPVNS